VSISNTCSPISSSNGDDAEFCKDHGAADGGRDFFATFYAETDVSVTISYDDKRFEAGPLTGSSLFLYGANLRSDGYPRGMNLHDFMLKFGEEVVDNLVFFDW
jgi:hypothetical protein